MKKILILHAWYSRPEDNWYPWLKSKLEKSGYEVYVPDLPTQQTNLPDLKNKSLLWKRISRLTKTQ